MCVDVWVGVNVGLSCGFECVCVGMSVRLSCGCEYGCVSV